MGLLVILVGCLCWYQKLQLRWLNRMCLQGLVQCGLQLFWKVQVWLLNGGLWLNRFFILRVSFSVWLRWQLLVRFQRFYELILLWLVWLQLLQLLVQWLFRVVCQVLWFQVVLVMCFQWVIMLMFWKLLMLFRYWLLICCWKLQWDMQVFCRLSLNCLQWLVGK